MEGLHLAIFEKFTILSKVMPYFSYTHKMFLVLSLISKDSRFCLSENYRIFCRIMLPYSIEKEVTFEDLLRFSIPFDLFRFSFGKHLIKAEDLIILANKLANKEGLYFGEHYMHEQLCISRIFMNAENIRNLCSQEYSLKSIQIIDNSELINNDIKASSLLDQIVLNNISLNYDDENSLLRLFISNNGEDKDTDPIFNTFKRIEQIVLFKETARQLLKMIQKSNILNVESLNFENLTLDDFHEVINSSNFNYKIKRLYYNSKDYSLINDTTLENIAKFNLSELILSRFSSVSNAIRVLSILPEKTNVSFGLEQTSLYSLKFLNTKVYLKDKDNALTVNCKEMLFGILNGFKANDIFLNQSKYVLVKNFDCFKRCTFIKEKDSTDTKFESSPSIETKFESYIIVPTNSLQEVRLSNNQLQVLLSNKSNQKNFNILSQVPKFRVSLSSMEDFVEFEESSEYVSSHCELEYTGWFYISTNEEEDEGESEESGECVDLKTLFINTVLKFKLRVLNPYCKEDEKEDLYFILSQSSVQNSLQNFEYADCMAPDCLSMLTLCSKCKQLESVTITYYAKTGNSLDKEIADAMKNIRIHCQEIKKLKIKLKCYLD